MGRIVSLVLAGVAVAAAAGCGGGNGSCASAACGGNVVGTWTISSICSSPGSTMTADGGASCSVTASTNNVRETGTITFNNDGTYTSNFAISGSASEVIPTSCLGGITCAEYNTLLMTAVGTGVISSASCTMVASGCSCQFQYSGQPMAGSGTYSTSGTTITDTASGSTTPSTSNYCVQGSTLTLSSMSMAGMGGMTGPTASVVLTKS